MPERFAKAARGVAKAAQREATDLGSTRVEAEHILLALLADTGVAGDALAGAGLNHARVAEALEQQHARSLMAVGVDLEDFDIPARQPSAARPSWGTSAQVALERSLDAARASGDRRIGSGHVLIGLLGAHEGTVPRFLSHLDVSPDNLADATRLLLRH